MNVKRASAIVAFSMIFSSIAGMEQSTELAKSTESVCKTIDDIPEYCADLVHQCVARPGSKLRRTVLSCSSHDAWIIYYLDAIAEASSLSEARKWRVEFPGGVKDGIELIVHDNEDIPSKEDITREYKPVIEKIRCGWIAAQLKDYPDIAHQKNEKEWYLFINKTPLNYAKYKLGERCILTGGRQGLILSLRDKFGIGVDRMTEDSWWRGKNDEIEQRPDVCLWIEKNALEGVQKAFKFKISKD